MAKKTAKTQKKSEEKPNKDEFVEFVKEKSMSFINMALGEAKEKTTVPAGTGYDLVIEDAQLSKDSKRVVARISIEGHPEAKAIFHSISLPQPGDDPDKVNTKLLFGRAFLNLFGIEWGDEGFDLSDFPGSRANDATLDTQEYNGVESNVVVLRI